jgi:hypothetical protein
MPTRGRIDSVPDQRYVNSIMDTAVRSLRNASRSWAFNPKGR